MTSLPSIVAYNQHSNVNQIARITFIQQSFFYQFIVDIKGVLREVWINDIQPNNFSSLTEHQDYPENPHRTEVINSFNSNEPGYGQRLRAYFAVPKTGLYDFHISCNKTCVLWLETQPGKTYITCRNM